MIISIDGNYDSEFDVSFCFNHLSSFYESKGYEIKTFFIKETESIDNILSTINNIANHSKKNKSLCLINGSIAAPIIHSIISDKNIQKTTEQFQEVMRQYACAIQKIKTVNLLCVKKGNWPDLYNGFMTIDSMAISNGFNFKTIEMDGTSLIDLYRQVVEIIEDNGWEEIPPLLN